MQDGETRRVVPSKGLRFDEGSWRPLAGVRHGRVQRGHRPLPRALGRHPRGMRRRSPFPPPAVL
jgi:hypothetical protein